MRTTHLKRIAVGGLLVLAAAACSSSSPSSSSSGSGSGSGSGSANKSPVTLTFVGGISGVNGVIGLDAIAGAKAAVAQINAAGGVDGGHPLALNAYDSQGDPSDAVVATRKALAAGNRLFYSGPWSSPECLAMAPLIERAGGMMINTLCSANQLVGAKNVAPDFYLASASDSQSTQDEAAFIKAGLPATTQVDIIGYNYLVAKQVIQGELADAAAIGHPLSVHKAYYVPLDTEDFATAVTALSVTEAKPTPNRLLIMATFGDGSTSLALQAAPYHFLQNYAGIITVGGWFSSAVSLKGKAPAVWDNYSYEYQAAVNPTVNNAFLAAYAKVAGTLGPANDWTYEGWVAAQEYAAAINKAHSTSPTAIQAAMNGLTIQAPTGAIVMHTDVHQAAVNTMIYEIVGDPSAPNGIKLLKWYAVNSFTHQVVASGS
jgi:branched-chain amino acid transport system substrate-binding protein